MAWNSVNNNQLKQTDRSYIRFRPRAPLFNDDFLLSLQTAAQLKSQMEFIMGVPIESAIFSTLCSIVYRYFGQTFTQNLKN